MDSTQFTSWLSAYKIYSDEDAYVLRASNAHVPHIQQKAKCTSETEKLEKGEREK